MADVILHNLTKSYGAFLAVDNVSLHVADGEFLTLLGPSGCGKSTTLAALAGLDKPTSGQIRVGERVFFDSSDGTYVEAEGRNIGLVFQSYALWPHMTVRQNLAYPLKLRKIPRATREDRIDEALSLVEMLPYADRYPNELSGGQQQRVALARTLCYRPSIMLLDEPLSNLDAKLRERARAWLRELQTKVRITTIYVTHDQSEALALSDRIAVMNKGKVAQLGTPAEIYENPNDPFVADFIGSSNFLSGTLLDKGTVELRSGYRIAVPDNNRITLGGAVRVAVRPEAIKLHDRDTGSSANIPAKIKERTYLGARYMYECEVGQDTIRVEDESRFDKPDLWLELPKDRAVVFSENGRVG